MAAGQREWEGEGVGQGVVLEEKGKPYGGILSHKARGIPDESQPNRFGALKIVLRLSSFFRQSFSRDQSIGLPSILPVFYSMSSLLT